MYLLLSKSCSTMFSLMFAVIVGPRIGRFDPNGKAVPIPGHSITLYTLGVFILWYPKSSTFHMATQVGSAVVLNISCFNVIN